MLFRVPVNALQEPLGPLAPAGIIDKPTECLPATRPPEAPFNYTRCCGVCFSKRDGDFLKASDALQPCQLLMLAGVHQWREFLTSYTRLTVPVRS